MRRPGRRAFSLMEVTIAVATMVTLSYVVLCHCLPSRSYAVSVRSRLEREQVRSAETLYRFEHAGRGPSEAAALERFLIRSEERSDRP